MTTQSTHIDDGHRPDLDDQNIDAVIRVTLIFAACFFLASHLPHALVAAFLQSLLLVSAAVSGGLAAFTREHPFVDHFTRWDEAAALATLGFLAGFLVDPGAVAAALASMPKPAG